MNAYHLAFPNATFDTVLSGFMGWYDCFDFDSGEFTKPDLKSPEILRVLRDNGKFVCCSWKEQYDLRWMEEAMLRHYPQLLDNEEYLTRRPIGMAYEKPSGYELIFSKAGFRDIKFSTLEVTCHSTDEEEWWQQMKQVGWKSLLETIKQKSEEQYMSLKRSIFKDLQLFKSPDGIIFKKIIFFVSCLK